MIDDTTIKLKWGTKVVFCGWYWPLWWCHMSWRRNVQSQSWGMH
jgi:hypothetical protein